jgi:Na+-transporting NADH:ubiquinone oxidoreductase subunit C
MASESTSRTLLTALVICVVCSMVVAIPTVALKPLQDEQKLLDKQKAVLAAGHLLPAEPTRKNIQAAFANLEVRMVELASGEFTEGDGKQFSLGSTLKDPAKSRALPSEADPAGIRRQELAAPVYIKRNEDGTVGKVILPVRGYGLWSTLHGFIALNGDGSKVDGLIFYQHAETPGLGGEVDNPKWRSLWNGKELYNDQGELAITVVKGAADKTSAAYKHQVDGLAGATLTAKGVDNLVRYWLSDNGFGAFLNRIRSKGV